LQSREYAGVAKSPGEGELTLDGRIDWVESRQCGFFIDFARLFVFKKRRELGLGVQREINTNFA